MVERWPGPLLDGAYGSLAHGVRRDILDRVRAGPATVGDLASPYDISLAAVSKHIRVLEDAGLLRREVIGREHLLTLAPRPLARAAGWLEAYRALWDERLDALDRHLRRGR